MNVWVNQILYYNKIYPQEAFDRKKSFNLVVLLNRNPALQEFIEKFTNDFLEVLIGRQTGGSKVNQISINVFDQGSGDVVKRYILHFNDLLIDLGKTLGSQIDAEDRSSVINIEGITWDEIYTQFNTLLYEHLNELKTNEMNELKASQTSSEVSEELLKTGPDLFFKIIIELDESVSLATTNWIRVKSKGSKSHRYKSIGEVSLGLINFDLHNEYVV